jgi:hypothetical protein
LATWQHNILCHAPSVAILSVDSSTFQNNELAALNAEYAETVVIRNCEGLAIIDMRGSDVLDCDTQEGYCLADYCTDTEIRFKVRARVYTSDTVLTITACCTPAQCYCDPDGIQTDANLPCLSGAEMSDPVVGTSELFTLLTDKSDVIGTTSVYFSNRGDVMLVWCLTLLANPEDAPWVASMYEGQLPAGETAEITLTLNTTLLQARNNPYLTSFILNSTSPTPTPVPITRSLAVGLRAIVSASPDPNQSIITLHNVGSLTASGTIVVDVASVDSTGRAVLDASSVAYTGILTHNASTTTVTCAFAYDASIDCHRSYCALPPLKEGSFTLRVNDGDGAAVGGGRIKPLHYFALPANLRPWWR